MNSYSLIAEILSELSVLVVSVDSNLRFICHNCFMHLYRKNVWQNRKWCRCISMWYYVCTTSSYRSMSSAIWQTFSVCLIFAIYNGKIWQTREIFRGVSRTAATSKMVRFVIIVNGWKFHLGCCSSPRSASDICHIARSFQAKLVYR